MLRHSWLCLLDRPWTTLQLCLWLCLLNGPGSWFFFGIIYGPVISTLLIQLRCCGTAPWSVRVTVITFGFCLVLPCGAALLWLLPDINSLQKEDYLKHSFSKDNPNLKISYEIHCGIKILLKNLRQLKKIFFRLSLKENLLLRIAYSSDILVHSQNMSLLFLRSGEFKGNLMRASTSCFQALDQEAIAKNGQILMASSVIPLLFQQSS